MHFRFSLDNFSLPISVERRGVIHANVKYQMPYPCSRRTPRRNAFALAVVCVIAAVAIYITTDPVYPIALDGCSYYKDIHTPVHSSISNPGGLIILSGLKFLILTE